MALISRLSLTGLCAALMLSQPAFAAKVITVDRIVAVINKNVITARELDERLRLTQANLKRQNVTPPAEDVLRAQLLDRMINDEVQLQFASDNGIRVDDAQLDAALNRIAEQNQLTLPQLKEALAKDGIPFDRFRDDIRREILMNRVKEREVEDRIFISDAEVDSFLKQQAAEQGHGSEFLLQNIVVTVPEQASPEVVREREQRAQAALAELKAGKPFAEVAAAYSNAGNAMQGGQLGWRPGNRLPDIYVEVASKLDKGQLSTLVKTANGFHIIQLLDKRQSNDALVVEQVHARHILIKTNEAVSEGDAKARLVAIKERLDNGGKFEELARLHSEDSSASKGGDLGWLNPGDTVPEFEKAMNTLSLNQVSGPVRSQFGWHLIQVLERRKQDVSGDRARLEARQALKERKADEQYEEWVRQQRDSAFVEVKLQDE
ncbi:peptidylprolyl isomerase [Leeia aquatica]|uniref:Chaperone SurA n=1 Tax=Leeia aquatica TaxID=2725557 RepID=A0A847SKS8_9NEIS|nr:peptidylprolyl isomerase [Leeia aquatica]NLR76522.1 molecular chaperone SurA [Leeia aquatica]